MTKSFIIMLLSLLMLSPALNAQTKKSRREIRKERRAYQRAKKEKQEEIKRILVDTMVHNRLFLLKADQIYDKYGRSYYVDSHINFIKADDNKGVVQFGSSQLIGRNGFGGSTLKGSIQNYEVKEKKNGYSISFNLHAPGGHLNIFIHIDDLGRGSATVQSAWGGELRYRGEIVPVKSGEVFQGTQTF